MKIVLFGVSCVGKTTTAELLAQKLGYKFYDLDAELKAELGITLRQFMSSHFPYERDKIRGGIINSILGRDENMVFSLCPIYYIRIFKHSLHSPDVLSIELRDTPENIFSRLIFTDADDVPYKDDEYAQKHRKEYLSKIKTDTTFYRNACRKLGCVSVFDMNGDSPDVVVERIIRGYSLSPQSLTE